MSRLLTPEEAANVLGVERPTVLKWARSGYVPAHGLGEGRRRIWRFTLAELERFVLEQGSLAKQKYNKEQ